MILRIIFTNKGIKLLDFYTLPPDVVDCINDIVYNGSLHIDDDEILTHYYDEMCYLLYSLNIKFDLLIKRG